MTEKTLYERPGGYDGITGFVENLLPRLQANSQLGRFWQNRGSDGIKREKQLLINYLCSNSGRPVYYSDRNMKLSHEGMKRNESDWLVLPGHAGDTMSELSVPQQECDDVVAFVLRLKDDIVEA